MSLAETKAAAADAEARARARAAEIVESYWQSGRDAAPVIEETAGVILDLAEKRAALVHADDLARFRAGLPGGADAVADISARFIAEHRLAAWIECLIDLTALGG